MRKSFLLIVVVVLIALFASLFVVEEGQRGIVLRFGKVLRDSDNKPFGVCAWSALQNTFYRDSEKVGCPYSNHGQPS